jgi:hypothetical protein
MPKVFSDRLKPGMKLAKPVLRGSIVLLSEGTLLTDTWIRRLQDMDIEAVYIDGPSRQSTPKDKMIAQLERRFKTVEDKPHMGLLKRMVREHIEGLYE